MKKIFSILFWSIISAAFIGPGTVTTAASAGARFEYALLWALLFSTFATVILQEASARITIVSGLSLGQAIRHQFHGGARGWLVLILVVGAIIFGCAAYEAGNILGGVSGALLGTGISFKRLTLILGSIAGIILWLGTPRIVAYILSAFVAFMGFAFLVTAWKLNPDWLQILRGSFTPGFPAGSGLLILGLIGTTVVPYNLFLGSGIARGQSLSELRFGLSIAVILGGIISMGVLVVGTSVPGAFSFESLARTLSERLGSWAEFLFAFGLCAAGLSSAITAPLAAAVTARSLFESENSSHWHERSWRYRSVWLGVLIIGIVFGLADVKPIPAIILAQALNGVVLPFVAVFLLILLNDPILMGDQNVNGFIANTFTSLVVTVTIMIGIFNISKALASTLAISLSNQSILWSTAGLTLTLAWPVQRMIQKRRQNHSD
ncbi:MAG: divalent metal cation transporter [Calditrichaeota bacterium]|nr:MAG: divalent metal cation transporter [Calditrichota bacterium]